MPNRRSWFRVLRHFSSLKWSILGQFYLDLMAFMELAQNYLATQLNS
jgi:hypothetical protein